MCHTVSVYVDCIPVKTIRGMKCSSSCTVKTCAGPPSQTRQSYKVTCSVMVQGVQRVQLAPLKCTYIAIPATNVRDP